MADKEVNPSNIPLGSGQPRSSQPSASAVPKPTGPVTHTVPKMEDKPKKSADDAFLDLLNDI
jgi:hypothetical protein